MDFSRGRATALFDPAVIKKYRKRFDLLERPQDAKPAVEVARIFEKVFIDDPAPTVPFKIAKADFLDQIK